MAFFVRPGAASDSKVYIHKTKGYRLNEEHKSNGCLSCHPKSQRRGKKKDCGDCHEQRHDLPAGLTCKDCHTLESFSQIKNYRHDLPAGLTCKDCHTLESFSQIKNYRHLLNDFVQVGVHKTLACRECHPDGQFKGNRRQCIYCHMDRVQDSPHGLKPKVSGECDECHTPYGWQPVRFQHPDFTLQAAHRSLDCQDCHPGYEFQNVQSFCYTCHKRDFHIRAGFDHAAAGFSYDCLLCHSLNTFVAPKWKHPAGLISEGHHKSADCRDCHNKGIFHGLSEDCQTCHQKDYAATDSPNHLANAFPSDCDLCHRPNDISWNMGNKNHPWPLRGVHKTLDCSDCHQGGSYAGKSSACFSCHQADYERAPNHTGYPTTCDQCHQDSDSSWHQAVFNHPLPLVGGHAGLDCTECHQETANYAIFVCTDCHTRTSTNPIHRGVSGYNYNSQSCYNCHPRGQR